MPDFTLHIRRHYSGLFQGCCDELPSGQVFGRDQEQVVSLTEQARAAHGPALQGRDGDPTLLDGS